MEKTSARPAPVVNEEAVASKEEAAETALVQNKASYHPDPNEPAILELQRAAIRYAEVNPDKIANWRAQAAARALMPEVSVGYNNDIDDTITYASASGKTNFFVGPDNMSSGWDFTAKWDLGDLIYNTAQTSIDSRSKLMVELRNEIMEALNTAYFERKKLQRQLTRVTDTENPAYTEREIRIEELTATIDGLTGGYLSRKLGKE